MNRLLTVGVIRAALLLPALMLLHTSAAADTPSGKKIISEVQDTYEDLDSFSAKFRHTFIWAAAETKEVSEGTMELVGENQFRYETEQQVIVSDGQTLWRFNRSTNQAIAEPVETADPGALPRDFLFEFPKQFNVDAVEEVEDDLFRLDLVPKEEGMGVKDVQVWIDGDDWIATRLSFIDDTGNRTVYELEDIEIDAEIDPVRFNYNPPDSATIFDLR